MALTTLKERTLSEPVGYGSVLYEDFDNALAMSNDHQALTGIVGVILSFRFATKAWVRCSLPQVSAPERVWGLEDFLFLLAFSLDVTQMILIEMRYGYLL